MNIDAGLYRKAESYALRHRTNVQRLVENYVLTLLSTDDSHQQTITQSAYEIKPIEELPFKLRSLIGIARKEGVPASQDINGRDVRDEYLEKKYAK